MNERAHIPGDGQGNGGGRPSRLSAVRSARRKDTPPGPNYKWVALSNTTLGVLIATMDASIVIISLPAIFRGIGLDPLAPGNIGYLLWMIVLTGIVTVERLLERPRQATRFAAAAMGIAATIAFGAACNAGLLA